MTMQGETAAVRVAENEGKVDVFPPNRTPSSGRAGGKSWQYRWVFLLCLPANLTHLSEGADFALRADWQEPLIINLC